MFRKKKKQWPEILLHLLFWAVVFYIQRSFTTLYGVFMRNNNGIITEKILVKSVFPASLFTIALLMLLFYTNIFWLFKKIIKQRNGFVQAAIVAGGAFFGFFANYLVVRDLIGHTQITLSEWGRMQGGELLIFLFTAGISVAYFFSKEWIRIELLRKQMEASQLSTEIKFLKSQINPHFLFNTLNNLFSMAQERGNDELADSISKLSGMMRYMIYESNADFVPLKNEIEYLKSCIALNKLKYADEEARIVFNYPEKLEDLFIAPMIFIPFVENAFKHGVLIGRPSQIDISISVTDKQAVFKCENSNFSSIKKMKDSSSGIGLENTKRRLELIYAGNYELLIKSGDNKYQVTLAINLRK